MTKQLLVYRLTLLILFIIGAGMIIGGTWGISNAKKIDREYISTIAKIEKIHKHTERQHGKIHTRYDVVVNYMVSGKMYTENLNSYSSSMKMGDGIPLKYNPQKPSEVRSTEIEYTVFIVMICAGLILLILNLFMPRLFRKLKIIA